MKSFNWALFLGCCAIAIAILIAGSQLADRLPSVMTGNFSGTIADSDPYTASGDYMSDWQAAAFLGIDTEAFQKLAQSGELKGTYTLIQSSKVFSKEKLSAWVDNKINEGS